MLFQLGLDKNLIPYSDYSSVVIALGMGSAKKKPMTKKEREKKKAQGETIKEVVSIAERARLCLCRSWSFLVLAAARGVFKRSFVGLPHNPFPFKISKRSSHRCFSLLFLRGLCSMKVWPRTSIRADSVC